MTHIDEAKIFIDQIMNDHHNVCLCSSGGKDSLTLTHLAREHADKITIIHNSVGSDGWEGETENLLETAELWGYDKIKIVKPLLTLDEYIEHYGWPSHLLHDNMDGGFPSPWIGNKRVSGTWHCTMSRFIDPLFVAVQELECDAVMTGSRGSDGPAFERMGLFGERYDALKWIRFNPISLWTPAQVYAYIDANNIPLPPIYSEVKRESKFEVPDCKLCPWSADYINWLKDHRPSTYGTLKENFKPVWKELVEKSQDTLLMFE